MLVSGACCLLVFDANLSPATELRVSNIVCPSGYTNRPTPQNVGLFAFLRSIFKGFLTLAKSQTLPRALSLPTQARILLGVFPPFATDSPKSQSLVTLGLWKSLSLHNPCQKMQSFDPWVMPGA